MAIETISIWELSDYLAMKDTRLVDVREPEEYAVFHLKQAINIPLEQVERSIRRSRANITWIFYCDRGNLSMIAAARVNRMGYRAIAVVGGIKGFWEGTD